MTTKNNTNIIYEAPTLENITILYLCVYGPTYGRFNNQMLTIHWAMMLAGQQHNTLLALARGTDYLAQNWNHIFGYVPGVVWRDTPVDDCNTTYSWEQVFMDMIRRRPHVSIQAWPFLLPQMHVRKEAERIWNELRDREGLTTRISLHGRSFEGSHTQCSSSEHAGYKCNHDYACDYSSHNILSRFGSFVGNTTDAIVLISDGQNPEYAQAYQHQETTAPLEVQMWMMAISDIHIGAPGSSQDYVVWRWRQEVNPNGIMLPPDCYTKKQIA